MKNAMLIICFAFTANLLADGKMGNSTKESNAVVKTPCNHQIHRHCLRKLVKEKRGKKRGKREEKRGRDSREKRKGKERGKRY